MQGSNSHLRRGTVVVGSEYTEDMRLAERRIVAVNDDEEDEEENSSVDDETGEEVRVFQQVVAAPRRACQGCGDDISGSPQYHTHCRGCFFGGRRSAGHSGRNCQDYGMDISRQPQTHSRCPRCFSQSYRQWGEDESSSDDE